MAKGIMTFCFGKTQPKFPVSNAISPDIHCKNTDFFTFLPRNEGSQTKPPFFVNAIAIKVDLSKRISIHIT